MIDKIEVEVSTDIQRVAVSFEQGVLAIGGVEFPGRMTPARSVVAQKTIEVPGLVVTMQDFAESEYFKIKSKAQIVSATEGINDFFSEVTGEKVAPWQLYFNGAITRGDSGLRIMNFVGVALARSVMKTKGDRINMIPGTPEYVSRNAARLQSVKDIKVTPALRQNDTRKNSELPPRSSLSVPHNLQKTTEEAYEKIREAFMFSTIGRLISADDLVLEIKNTLPEASDAEIRRGIQTELERLTKHEHYSVTYNSGRLLIVRKIKK